MSFIGEWLNKLWYMQNNKKDNKKKKNIYTWNNVDESQENHAK
jgi:hypothetical protein